jgi:hypothetical protein
MFQRRRFSLFGATSFLHLRYFSNFFKATGCTLSLALIDTMVSLYISSRGQSVYSTSHVSSLRLLDEDCECKLTI